MLSEFIIMPMCPTFTYFKPEEISPPIDSFSLAFWVVEHGNLIIDSIYLPVIEAAQRGHVPAICEMAILFGSGAQGLPKSYTWARFHTDVLKDYNKGKPNTEAEALFNSGLLEYEFGNLEAAKTEFIEAAKIMVNFLPTEQWNFRVFEYLDTLNTQLGHRIDDEIK